MAFLAKGEEERCCGPSDEHMVAAAELLSHVVTSLVDRTDKVSVTPRRALDGVVFTVDVALSDQRFVVGKHGNTVKSIRIIFGAIARKYGEDYRIEVITG